MPPPRFGVALTTRDRREVFDQSYAAWRRHTPDEVPIIVVDDGSCVPVPNATHRNPVPQGVAAAKNHALRLLMDLDPPVDYLFLADDDCFPLGFGWEEEYIEIDQDFLSYQPTKRDYCRTCADVTTWAYCLKLRRFTCEGHEKPVEIYRDAAIRAVNWGAGVMLFLTRRAVETCGGMRTEFGQWGAEHSEYACRIANTMDTVRFPFADVLRPQFWARDAHIPGRHSVVPPDVREEHRRRNWDLFTKYRDSTGFVPYIEEESR